MTLKQTELAIEQILIELEKINERLKAVEDTMIDWPRPKGGNYGRADVCGRNAEDKLCSGVPKEVAKLLGSIGVGA